MLSSDSIIRNAAIFDGAPETKQALDKRAQKSQFHFCLVIVGFWLFIKGFMSFLFMEYSVFQWAPFLDISAIVVGALVAWGRFKDLLMYYRYNTDQFRQAFDTRYSQLQFAENKAKVRAYMNHPNLADRHITMAEVTALMTLLKVESDESKKVDYSADVEDEGKGSILSD